MRFQVELDGISLIWIPFGYAFLGPIFLGVYGVYGGKGQERLDELELGCSWTWNSEIWRCPGLGVPQVTMGFNMF